MGYWKASMMVETMAAKMAGRKELTTDYKSAVKMAGMTVEKTA